MSTESTEHPEAAALPALPTEGVRRVLCVVAHPDDMEYGTSAAVAAWTGAGIEVTYLLLTRGEAGMAEAPEVVAPLREREQRSACARVGVEDLRYLDHPDGMLEHGLVLRRDIARVIRQVRPELVLTANFEVEAYGPEPGRPRPQAGRRRRLPRRREPVGVPRARRARGLAAWEAGRCCGRAPCTHPPWRAEVDRGGGRLLQPTRPISRT